MRLFRGGSAGVSTALIDITGSSVGVGLLYVTQNKNGMPQQPLLCYTARVPVSADFATQTDGMLRALDAAGDLLVREGAPALRRATGQGSVDRVFVSVGSPWQEAEVETRSQRKNDPFTFTKSTAKEIVGQTKASSGHLRTEATVATFLNGYLVSEPYGKRASRAEIIVLSTLLDEAVASAIEERLHQFFHTRDINYTSFGEGAYTAFHRLFPLEKDFLVLSVERRTTEVISAKRGHLIDAGSLACGSDAIAGGGWTGSLTTVLRAFASRHALPRTVFLMCDDHATQQVTAILQSPDLHSLWLSDEPISIIPVLLKPYTNLITFGERASSDVRLASFACFVARPGA